MTVHAAMLLLSVLANTAGAQDAGSAGYLPVTAEEVVTLLTRPGPARVIDVRLETEYARAHIPGSILLPWEKDVDRFVATLPADKSVPLVFYCNGPT